MVKKTDKYEYTTRDFSAVDKQVEEFARREREITNKIRQENLRKLSITSVIFAGALAIIILPPLAVI